MTDEFDEDDLMRQVEQALIEGAVRDTRETITNATRAMSICPLVDACLKPGAFDLVSRKHRDTQRVMGRVLFRTRDGSQIETITHSQWYVFEKRLARGLDALLIINQHTQYAPSTVEGAIQYAKLWFLHENAV